MQQRMTQELLDALSQYLQQEMQRSQSFRALVKSLGQWLQQEAESPPEGVGEGATASRAGASPAIAGSTPLDVSAATPAIPQTPGRAANPTLPVRTPTSAGIVPLRIGDAAVNLPVTGTTEEIGRARASVDVPPASSEYVDPILATGAEVDLSLVAKRCRLKAESCLLYIERRAAAGDPTREPAIVERVSQMISQAKAMPDCFLWVLWRERSQPDDQTLRGISDCYAALAAAAALVDACDEHADSVTAGDNHVALQLLAEANSALRIALQHTWLTAPDVDQDEVHAWLRRETAVRRIHIPRYMRLDDPGDPAGATVIIEQARQIAERIEQRSRARKSMQELIAQVRYHVRNLDKADADYNPHDCRKIAEALERLDALGLDRDDRRITELLARVDVQRFFRDVAPTDSLRAWIDAAVTPGDDAVDDEHEEEPARAWSERVAQVRQLIQGTTAVLVGGVRRQQAVDRIREAFNLADVEWVRLAEHGSGEAMRAPIGRPETGVVLVLVKLAGHLHVDEARLYAQKSGKPCILLKAGYNPEQIADALLQQWNAPATAAVTK